MSARRKRRPVRPAVWIDWSDTIAELLGPHLVGDLQPPARVRVWAGRDHTTIVARFINDHGQPLRMTMRIHRQGASS